MESRKTERIKRENVTQRGRKAERNRPIESQRSTEQRRLK
jgi:hypothetical protein